MSDIIWYVFFGILFNWFWDWLSDVTKNDKMRLTMLQRFTAIFLWPAYLISFIYHFIKSINGNND